MDLKKYSLQLEKSQDDFSVVAEYFGRGVFNKVGDINFVELQAIN